ncbi:MAG: VOC family protein [Gallionellaceae bacterium]|nr:VOC family protein [Gallionellaceae bacterium]
MITHIRHTGLVVADLEAAMRFWCDLLGFKVTKRMDESGAHIDAMMGLDGVKVTTVKLAAPDGNLVELLHFHTHPDQPVWTGTPYSTGFTHIALTVDDLDAACQRLAEAGVTFSAPPQISPDGYAKVTYCRGPEGVLLELVEVLMP